MWPETFPGFGCHNPAHLAQLRKQLGLFFAQESIFSDESTDSLDRSRLVAMSLFAWVVWTHNGSMALRSIYSAPRRFDLASILVVTLAFSLLFGCLSALSATPMVYGIVCGFVVLVGVSQAALFAGKRPRLSSLLVGAAGTWLAVALLLVPAILRFPTRTRDLTTVLPQITEMIWGSVWLMAWGAIAGYLTGALIGGVFLVADVARQFLQR